MLIDLDAYRTSVAACNASRRRRFSADGPRRRWYAAHRRERFARRFGK